MVNAQTYEPFQFLKILRNTKDGAEGMPITRESSNTSVEMQLKENKVTNAAEFAKLFHVSIDAMSGAADDTAALAKVVAIPLMTAIQCALNRVFLLESEKGSLYWAFDTKELLKGSLKERYEAY